MTPRVLVTGGTGFLGGHVIARLLGDGYRVRATVRSLDRADDVRAALAHTGSDFSELSFVAADLTRDDGWPEAVDGCEYVLHVASPFPPSQPKDESDVIRPAVDGTVRVLRAAHAAGVRRVVLTSSFAAIGYTVKASGEQFDENDWTDPTGAVDPYVKSKTLAERAAWDFAGRHGLDLTVINPVGIFGPLLGSDFASSIGIIKTLLDGTLPLLPRSSFAVVDVRDVADLHVTAMTHSDAGGQRFLASSGPPMTMPEIAAVLRNRLGDSASRVPTRAAPDWLVKGVARFVPALQTLAGLLGEPKAIAADKATTLLGWQPRSGADAVTATARSLLNLGLVRV